MTKPDLEEVIERSAVAVSGGRVYCFGCQLGMSSLGWPCTKHMTDEERVESRPEIAAAIQRECEMMGKLIDKHWPTEHESDCDSVRPGGRCSCPMGNP